MISSLMRIAFQSGILVTALQSVSLIAYLAL